MDVLVIGGTGPTGPHIVNSLVESGHHVTILHSGKHEADMLPPVEIVPHIHADAFDQGSFSEAVDGLRFDLAISMYGRLRMIAPALAGKVGRFFSIGGAYVYSGFSEGDHLFPTGMSIPAYEDSPLVDSRDARKVLVIRHAEEVVFDSHPTATHFRYPGIYGPHQVLPLEWPVVKRALDKRPTLILPDAGLHMRTGMYAENAAHAVILAVELMDASEGQIYNVSDDRQFTLKQVVEIIEREVGHTFEIVDLPYDVATCSRPFIAYHASEHRMIDAGKIRHQLGYRDKVDPLDGMAQTIRWQVQNLGSDHADIDARLQDPFDYDAEDRLVAEYRNLVARCAKIEYRTEPGWTIGYYGARENPAGRPIGLR